MFTVIIPIPRDLETALYPFRQKYDKTVDVASAHISILPSFDYFGEQDTLDEHLQDVCENYAPIKVSLAGWDLQRSSRGYEMRLPIIAGRSELVALKSSLSSGILSQLPKQNETGYWPHIHFGEVAHQELEEVKKQLLNFEPQFIFRSMYLELLQRSAPDDPWQTQKKYGLKATVTSPRRRAKTPTPLRIDQTRGEK